MPASFNLTQHMFTDAQMLLALCWVWETVSVRQGLTPAQPREHYMDWLFRSNGCCPAENKPVRAGLEIFDV